MRKILILLSTIVLLANSANIEEAQQQANKGKRKMTRAGFTFMGNKLANLNMGADKTFKLLLYKGNTYALLGYGDKGVIDLDVQVYTRNWELIESDYDPNGAMYALMFKVKETGLYYIRTIMYQGSGYFIQSVGWK